MGPEGHNFTSGKHRDVEPLRTLYYRDWVVDMPHRSTAFGGQSAHCVASRSSTQETSNAYRCGKCFDALATDWLGELQRHTLVPSCQRQNRLSRTKRQQRCLPVCQSASLPFSFVRLTSRTGKMLPRQVPVALLCFWKLLRVARNPLTRFPHKERVAHALGSTSSKRRHRPPLAAIGET